MLTANDSAIPAPQTLPLTGTGLILKAVSLAVTPAATTIPKTTTQQFHSLEGFNNGVTKDVTSTVAWSSSAPGVALVGNIGASKGVASGLAIGTTTITAKLATPALTGSTTLTVGPAPLTSITVTPGAATLAAGLTQQFVATGRYADNSTQDVSALAFWSSSTGSASVVQTGLATAITSGTANITASIGTVSGSGVLTVNPATITSITVTPGTATVAAGLAQQFSAMGTYTNGATKDVSGSATWTSSNVTVTVSATGLAQTTASGIAMITASLGTVTSSAALTVDPPALVSLSISPGTATVPAGLTQQFSAAGTYTDNSTKDVSALASWSSSNGATASVGTTGLATAITSGTVNITASLSSVSGSATLTVNPATLVSLSVSPGTVTVAAGLTQQFSAIGTYTNGSTQDLSASALWSSSSPGVALVGANGLATGIAVGTTNITASLSSVSGSATLTVNPAALVSLSVSPGIATVAAGLTQQFLAIGTYTNGTTQDLSTQAAWVSSDPSVASIDGTGLATGLAVGVSNITAALGTATAGAQLTVSP